MGERSSLVNESWSQDLYTSGAVGRLKKKKKRMMTKSRFCRFP